MGIFFVVEMRAACKVLVTRCLTLMLNSKDVFRGDGWRVSFSAKITTHSYSKSIFNSQNLNGFRPNVSILTDSWDWDISADILAWSRYKKTSSIDTLLTQIWTFLQKFFLKNKKINKSLPFFPNSLKKIFSS